MRKTLFFIFFICFTGITVFSAPSKKSVIQTIKQISKRVPGIFGVAAVHLQSGQSIEINAHKQFPTASTYKVAIGAYCLSLLDNNVIDKQKKITITKQTMRRYCFVSPGQRLSVKQLIYLMIKKSDNAASDIILKMVGGGNAVTQWLQKKTSTDFVLIDLR